MKHQLLIFIAFLALLSSCSQNPNVVEKKIWVRGNCSMCKERIESHVKLMNGVKSAQWDVKSKLLTVKYDSTLTNEMAVETICANAGHSTPTRVSGAKVLSELPECCQPSSKSHP